MKWLLVLCLLKWSYGQESSEEVINGSSVTFLFSSSSGMQFKKDTNDDGTVNIIYDCSIGLTTQGSVDLFETAHPENMRKLIVENCQNVTIVFSCDRQQSSWYGEYDVHVDRFQSFKSLIVKNVISATLMFPETYYGRNNEINFWKYRTEEEIYIKDVKNFHVSGFHKISCFPLNNFSLKLKNVEMKNLGSWDIRELQMSNVKVRNIESNSVTLSSKTKSELVSIEDSHFENIEPDAFSLNTSRVEFFNNSFSNIQRLAFHILADESFIFSDNYVSQITDSFNITTPKVNVTWNTFENERNSWTKHIVLSGNGIRVLNISRNTMNVVPEGFLIMNTESKPDLIILENNYMNCTCRNWNLFSHDLDTTNSLRLIFFEPENQNLCVNLGNCTVNKVVKRITEVCSNRFVCTDPETQDTRNGNRIDRYFETIILSLKNISDILYQIADGHNSLHTNTQDLVITEGVTESGDH